MSGHESERSQSVISQRFRRHSIIKQCPEKRKNGKQISNRAEVFVKSREPARTKSRKGLTVHYHPILSIEGRAPLELGTIDQYWGKSACTVIKPRIDVQGVS